MYLASRVIVNDFREQGLGAPLASTAKKGRL